MININEELKHYENIDLSCDHNVSIEENICNIVQQSIDKLTRFQQKTYDIVEDVANSVEILSEKITQNEEDSKLLSIIIDIIDLYDDNIKLFSSKKEDELVSKFKSQNNKINLLLEKANIVKIDNTLNSQLYDKNLHIEVKTEKDPLKLNNEIIQVLKSGNEQLQFN